MGTIFPINAQKSNKSMWGEHKVLCHPHLHPLSCNVLLHSSVFGQLLFHSIFLFRTCTLGSNSQSGLCHCWGVRGGGEVPLGMWGLVGPVGSSYSRQHPSRPDLRTIGIKLLLFFLRINGMTKTVFLWAF